MKSNYLINFQLFPLSSDLSEGPSTAEIDVDKFFLLIGRLNTWNWPSTPIRARQDVDSNLFDFCLLPILVLAAANCTNSEGQWKRDDWFYWPLKYILRTLRWHLCYQPRPIDTISFVVQLSVSYVAPQSAFNILFNAFSRWCPPARLPLNSHFIHIFLRCNNFYFIFGSYVTEIILCYKMCCLPTWNGDVRKSFTSPTK